MEYEHPSDEGTFASTAINHVGSTTEAKVEIQLKLGPSFIFSGFDAMVFDIHLDSRHVHSGLPTEADEHAIIKDITRETSGRWQTRSFNFANVEAQTSQAQLSLPTNLAAHTHSPFIVEPRSSEEVDSSSTGPNPRHPGPWRDLTASDKKDSRYLAREPGTIQIQAYRAKNLKANTTTEKKDPKADATTKRSVAEYAARTEALRKIPQPLDLHENQIKDLNLTHYIKFGAPRDASGPSVVAPGNKLYLDAIDQHRASFISCYRSKEILKAWDVRLPRGVSMRGMNECWSAKGFSTRKRQSIEK